MIELIKKIKAMWTYSQTAKLYFEQAPPETVHPYVVWSIVGNNRVREFNAQLNNVLLDFKVYSEDSSGRQALEILEQIETIYNEQDLDVTGFNDNCALLKVNELLTRETERDPNRWIGLIQFKIMLDKTKD
jgi:hypothetical protein